LLARMKSKCFLTLSALLMSGCAQVNDQIYSKKNFTSQSFDADISECKRQNPSFVAIRSYVADSQDRTYSDDAMVRDCMNAKGYTIQLETK
jgi:PBP1b-binding outer membrane lipoprotein LpoB